MAIQLSLYKKSPLERDSVNTAHSGGLSSNYGVRDLHYLTGTSCAFLRCSSYTVFHLLNYCLYTQANLIRILY